MDLKAVFRPGKNEPECEHFLWRLPFFLWSFFPFAPFTWCEQAVNPGCSLETYVWESLVCIGGSKVRRQGRPTPLLGSKFFYIYAVFWQKICKVIALLAVGVLPSGKSCIRHWSVLFFFFCTTDIAHIGASWPNVVPYVYLVVQQYLVRREINLKINKLFNPWLDVFVWWIKSFTKCPF